MGLKPTFVRRAASVIVALLAATAVASVAGSLLLYAWVFVSADGGVEELAIAPAAILLFACVAFVVILPLLIGVGLPLAVILRESAFARWMPLTASLGGALGGVLLAVVIQPDALGTGALYGALAGFFWHRFARRSLLIAAGE